MNSDVIDIRLLNPEAPWKRAFRFGAAIGGILISMSAIFTVLLIASTAGQFSSPRLTPGFDSFSALFLGAMGIGFIAMSYPPRLGTRLELRPDGMTIYYAKGTNRAFRWADPSLDLRLLIWFSPPRGPDRERCASVWGQFKDKTRIPIDVFDSLVAYLPTIGIQIAEYPGLQPDSKQYRFTRAPSA